MDNMRERAREREGENKARITRDVTTVSCGDMRGEKKNREGDRDHPGRKASSDFGHGSPRLEIKINKELGKVMIKGELCSTLTHSHSHDTRW